MVTNKKIGENLKSVIKVGLVLAYFASFFVTKAFIYDIHCLRRWDEESKRYCYFIGLGDFHDKKHSITDLQVKQIDQIVARCKKDRTKLIVEDICSEPTTGVRLCSKFFINSTGGLLGGIADKYRKSCENLGDKNSFGINGKNNIAGDNFGVNSKNNLVANNLVADNFVDNIEYRFCRVVSLAPVINNVNANYKDFVSTSKIKISGFRNEIMNSIKEISEYNDGENLKKWYKKATDSAIAGMDYLKFNSNLDVRVSDYLNMHSSASNRLNFVKKLLVFDSALIDAKIVHSIVNSGVNSGVSLGVGSGFNSGVNGDKSCSNMGNSANGLGNSFASSAGYKQNSCAKQTFIVIAGGSHIRNVSTALQAIGYKSIYESKVVVSPLAGQASQACAANNVSSCDPCCRPEPADLAVLERFI